MSRPQPHVRQLRKAAKHLLQGCRAADPDAIRRLRRHAGRLARHHQDGDACAAVVLRDAQLVVARENGFTTWDELVAACDDLMGVDREILE